MFPSTSNALTSPLGWGAQIGLGVYGQAIPTIIGMTKTSPIQIWNGFLVQAPGGGKGVQNYQKALDFLLGSNPIFGVLRLWEDQGARVGLNFVKYSQAITANGVTSITVPDAHLYWVVAVTFEVPYSVTFNDYGAPGPTSLSGTYEIPLWNTSYAGSNPGNMGAYRFAPWTYNWYQALGRVVQIPRNQFGAPWSGGTIHVYYAQLLSTVNPPYTTPLVQTRLFYEPTLGEGPEYGAAYATEQIKYPHLAGMASTNFFLGANFSTAPQIFPECIAAHSVWSTGDADFVDMIEDVFRSGFGQAGSTATIGYGKTQRGLNTFNFPALIQKNLQGSAADDATSLAYPLQNTPGNFLVVVSYNNTTGPTDDATNTWTLAYNWSAGKTSVWTAKAKPWQPGNTVHVSGGSAGASLLGIFEVGGADTLDVVASNSGATGDSSVTATTTGQAGLPELLVGILGYGISAWKLDSGWNEEIAASNGIGIASRIVKTPGNYTFHTKFTAASAPWFSGLLAFSNSGIPPYPNPFGDIIDQPSSDLCRAQGRAYGLKGSVTMDSQQKASDWLAQFAQAGNLDYCWYGFKLVLIPKAEPSAVGNGSIYNSPYAAGPLYDITPDDLIGDSSAPVITFEGQAPVDIPTLLQIQYVNRDSDYVDTTASETDNGAAAIYGVRKPDSPVVLRCIQDSATARSILNVMTQRRNLIDINAPIKFTGQAKLGMFMPGDLLTISDPLQGVYKLAIKLTSRQEKEDYSIDFEAEPFIYGANSPIPLTATAAGPNVNDPNAPASAINPPIIFEAVPPLGLIQGMGALWAVVSSPGPNYGGSFVFVSTDGGASYNQIGTIQGNATTGYTVGPLVWPASADPDTVNDLAVDLTESNGILSSYAVSDEDNFAYPCYVEPGAVGACVIQYELMTYALANLTATSKYTLKASGGGTNHLRRAVFGAPTPGNRRLTRAGLALRIPVESASCKCSGNPEAGHKSFVVPPRTFFQVSAVQPCRPRDAGDLDAYRACLHAVRTGADHAASGTSRCHDRRGSAGPRRTRKLYCRAWPRCGTRSRPESR